jgi:hypothetical protein
MRRIFGWLAGAVGGAAVYRALRRRPEVVEDPADELRARLAETREMPQEEPPAPPEPLDPEARRRAVHEQGRAAIDELRSE